MVDNWIEKRTKNGGVNWAHKNHINLQVIIQRNTNPMIGPKYFVLHYHPGPGASVVKQLPEYASTLAGAMLLARPHLKHWNDPRKWKSDPDYGKMGQRGK